MNDFLMSAARTRYDFDRLSSEAALQSAPPLGSFALSTHEFDTLTFVRRSPAPTDGNHYTDTYRTTGGEYVLITIQRARDSDAAHQSLLGYLANSMAERLPRAEQAGIDIGDTAFTNLAQPPTNIAFVRRNVFVKIALAQPAAGIDLATIAREVDRQIVAAPPRS